MIDDKILDEVLPVPAREETKNEYIAELQDKGFAITNFGDGGIFYTILMIMIQLRIELVILLRKILNNMFVSHAEGVWMELKAADFSKTRKKAEKTRGLVTVSRSVSGDAVKIPKGHVFKTIRDVNGDELRFLVTENTVLQLGALSVDVPIEAEKEGANYNVPAGQITRSLTHIEGGVDSITNGEKWITSEGSDIEEIESLRERTLSAWAELALIAIRDKIKNVAESVPGVLYASVDDMHPRGQGTFDVVVTGTAGAATPGLLEQVRTKVEKILGPYDDLLVTSSTTMTQAVNISLTIPDKMSDSGLADRVKAVVTAMMRISRSRRLNELLHADIIYAIKRDIPAISNVRVTLPEQDMILSNDRVIILGEVNVEIRRT